MEKQMRAQRISHKPDPAALVKEIVPLTSLFDPDLNPETLRECFHEFAGRISGVRVMIGHNERPAGGSANQSVAIAHRYNVPVIARVESPGIVINRGILPIYFDLCRESGVNRVQLRNTNLQRDIRPRDVVSLADDHNLDVIFEIDGALHDGGKEQDELVDTAMKWVDAGAVNIVACVTRGRALKDLRLSDHRVDKHLAARLANVFGLHAVMLSAPTESEQTELITAFGEDAHICDVLSCDVSWTEKLRKDVSVMTSFSGKDIVNHDND